MKRRILLAGPHWAGGELMESISMGFADAGCESAVFYDDRKNRYSYFRKAVRLMGLQKVYGHFSTKHKEFLNAQLLQKVGEWRPGVVVAVNGHNIYPETVRIIREEFHIPVICWFVDDISNWPGTAILSYVHAYSGILVGDEVWSKPLRFIKEGQPIACVPQGGDAHIFHPISTDKLFDISMVGNFLPNDPLFGISFLRANILNLLIESGFRLKIIGKGAAGILRYFPKLKNAEIQDGSISDEKFNEVYNQSKISLNLMAPQYHNDYSARVFNAALASGFQLVDYKHNLEKYFPKGEVIGFKDLRELKGLAEKYLKNDEERERLAALSRDTALKNHTWKHRADQVLEFLEALPDG